MTYHRPGEYNGEIRFSRSPLLMGIYLRFPRAPEKEGWVVFKVPPGQMSLAGTGVGGANHLQLITTAIKYAAL